MTEVTQEIGAPSPVILTSMCPFNSVPLSHCGIVNNHKNYYIIFFIVPLLIVIVSVRDL